MTDAVDDRHRDQALAVIEAVGVPIIVTRASDGTILMASEALSDLTGYPRDELIGRTVTELDLWAQPADRQALVAQSATGHDDEQIIGVRMCHRDGTEIDLVATFRLVELDGEPCFVSAARPTAGEDSAEASALRVSEERLRMITSAMDEGFAVVALEVPLRALYITPRFARILGSSTEALHHHWPSFLDAVHPADRDDLRRTRALMDVGQSSGRVEFRVRPVDGEERWVRLRWTRAEGDEQGALIAGVVDDITVQIQAERAAEAAQLEAERASRAKSTFLSRVSHELRTPLNAILGFGQLLEGDQLRPEQRSALGEMMGAGRHLLQLVDQVLVLSQAESGELVVEQEDVALAGVLRSSLEQALPEAARRDIQVRLSGQTAASVRGDARRLAEALSMVVDNAVVHNRRGGTVTIGCRTLPSRRVRIEVTDTGPGMSDDALERAHRPFERTGPGGGGTGLGLPLARHLVEAMGGALGADSVPGEGSTFWIELAPGETDATTTARPPTRRLLYVEDNASNAALAARALAARSDTELLVAATGEQGLALLGAESFDLLLLDLHLPDISGEDILARVRASADLHDLPVVVVSADASPEVVARVLVAGADEYLTKPIDIRDLLRVVDQHSHGAQDPDEAVPPRPDPADHLHLVPGPPAVEGVLDQAVLESLSVLEEVEPGSLAELVELFATAGLERVRQMEDVTAADGDPSTLATLGHTLRGSGANLGAVQLAGACRTLETEAGRADSAGGLALSVVAVRAAFDEAVVGLRTHVAALRGRG